MLKIIERAISQFWRPGSPESGAQPHPLWALWEGSFPGRPSVCYSHARHSAPSAQDTFPGVCAHVPLLTGQPVCWARLATALIFTSLQRKTLSAKFTLRRCLPHPLEETLMQGKMEGRRRGVAERMTGLDGIPNSVGMSLGSSKTVKDREVPHPRSSSITI